MGLKKSQIHVLAILICVNHLTHKNCRIVDTGTSAGLLTKEFGFCIHLLEAFMVGLGLMIVSGILRTRVEPVANLWTKNAVYARLIFHATVARGHFFQILHVICFDDKTTRNQHRSTDELNPIRGLFESVISRFKISTPSEHINFSEQVTGV